MNRPAAGERRRPYSPATRGGLKVAKKYPARHGAPKRNVSYAAVTMAAGVSATEKRSAACHERAPATQAATPSTGTTSKAESTRISSANPAAAPVTTGRFVCTPIKPRAIARATEGSEKPVATYGRSNVPKTVTPPPPTHRPPL